MKNFAHINLDDFQYDLPEERIAKQPLANRSDSRLLFYQGGRVRHFHFYDIPALLPENSLMVFNDTRVIPARLQFRRASGAGIEIFLLRPVQEGAPVEQAMFSQSPAVWSCMIGNKKKWKPGERLTRNVFIGARPLNIHAEWEDREGDRVRFSWDDPSLTFSEAIGVSGDVPLPPYIKRKPAEEDVHRYQTVYSQKQGAVAAPTAGLHFTRELIQTIRERGIVDDYLTLHVSAGTFQPVKMKNVVDHPMHNEQVVVSLKNLENLETGKTIIAVGTTAMRTLESLYWFGVKILSGQNPDFKIEKLAPYNHDSLRLPERREAILAVKRWMEETGRSEVVGETEIFIFPGYRFRMCDGLVTNFHLPGSTLILLVAAFIGDDWRKVYREALSNDYRFLSYGDGSLLLRTEDR